MQLSFNSGAAAATRPVQVPVGSRISLAELRQGESAVIDDIDLPGEMAHRLMELGFLPGSPVEAARSAPGGDPRVFRIDGTEIALRRETADHVLVRR
jgi:ferrous iron transport protein A